MMLKQAFLGLCVLMASACGGVIQTDSSDTTGDGGSAGSVITTTPSNDGGGGSTDSTTDTGGQGTGGSNTGGMGGEGGTGGGFAEPIITVSLNTSDVVSATYVKKTQGVNAVAFTVSATALAKLQSFTFTGQAEIAGSGCSFGEQCAREAFTSRVSSIKVFDGATQVGDAKAPDPLTGKATISNVNVIMPKDSTKTFTVKVSLTSLASIMEPFDKIAIGIEQDWEVENLDENDQSLLADVQSDLSGQTGLDPMIVQTIRPSGMLVITKNPSTPLSTLVHGGAVFAFVTYQATAQFEEITIDRMLLAQMSPYLADNADFVSVMVTDANNVVVAQNIMPAFGPVEQDLSQNKLVVPNGGSATFTAWAKPAIPIPGNLVNGAQVGVPRSGHAPALGIVSDEIDGEWTPDYLGKLNVRATGSVSGERIYADKGAPPGNPMWLRKSRPIITPLPVPPDPLSNGQHALYSWKIENPAGDAASLSYQQVAFDLTATPELTFCQFSLDADVTPVWQQITHVIPDMNGIFSYTPVDDGGNSCPGCGVCMNSGIVTVWTGEQQGEIVLQPGESRTYTLYAEVSGTVNGSSLTFKPHQTNTQVTKTLIGCSNPFSAQLIVDIMPAIIWSDMSEDPHTDSPCFPGNGSVDWIADALIGDLSMPMMLSAN